MNALQEIMQTFGPEETFRLGHRIGQKLQGGDVLCLYGQLGAGKTMLAKGIAVGLGITEEVTSPTFTFMQEYRLSQKDLRFIHMDLYRLQDPEEAEVIGVWDAFQEDTICLIEWPDLIREELSEDRLEIRIEGSGDLARTITITGTLRQIL